MTISLILPAFNEEANLEKSVRESYKILATLCEDFDIIIINDASIDNTLSIALSLQSEFGSEVITVINHTENRGQGACLYEGIKKASKEWVFHNGVDSPFSLEDLADCLKQREDADLLVVTRKNREVYSLWRKTVSIGLVKLINLFYGGGISDYSFVQIFRNTIVSDCLDYRFSSTAFMMPSFILNALRKGYRIKTIEKDYHQRCGGIATGASMRNIFQGVIDLIRYGMG
jgi:glycosyltransferase involved in cell wall biosynthesis